MTTLIDLENDIVLETDRVLLRPLCMDDTRHLLPFSLHEPALWKFSAQTAAGEENLVKYIQRALSARMSGAEYPLIVFDKKAGEYAGSTRFYDIQPTHRTVQLGYTWYGERFQRSGLNRHCKFVLLQHAFEAWLVERVEFRADATNERSIAAMKAIGCTVEGILRSNMSRPDGQGRRDSIVLSILQQEWRERVKEQLKALIAF